VSDSDGDEPIVNGVVDAAAEDGDDTDNEFVNQKGRSVCVWRCDGGH